MAFDHIAVLGAGAWGSALANILARGGRSVTLWARSPALAAAISTSRENARLPGIPIEQRVAITDRLADAAGADAILLAVPAQALRGVTAALAPSLREATPLVACAKGIER